MEYQEWRAALEKLVGEGLAEYQPARVAAALAAEGARAARQPARPRKAAAPAEPVAAASTPAGERSSSTAPEVVVGLDACRSGWVGVVVGAGAGAGAGAGGDLTVLCAPTVAAVMDRARDLGPVTAVAIDIPIGLPDAGSRQADVLARRALPGKASSVFTTLTRAAYEAPTYAEGRAANLAATGGASASAQAYALRAKILEVDRWVRAGAGLPVIEVHPELSFATMLGRPVLESKKSSEGADRRRAALASVGINPPAWTRGVGYAEDDLLDACAAAWSAARYTAGEADSLPAEPEVFADGIPAAIWR